MMKKTIKLQNKNKNTTKVKRYELSSPLFLESQRGVTLIEAMISLLIFSVGALGLAAMQLTAITASGDSQQRTMAIWKAQELADRIRSNPNLRQLYVAAIANPTITGIGVDDAASNFVCPAQPNPICSDAGAGNDAPVCTNQQQVDFDIWEVFCEPSTGAAVVGTDGGPALAAGSVGLTNLEVVLIDNQTPDGVASPAGNDMLLYFEWVSREADANADPITGIANNGQLLNTNLCDTDVEMASSLEAYCLRFQPF